MFINNSEINHLCYETGVCQIESCGGTTFQNRYSPGIEIYSNNVEIKNSEIKFAKNTSLLIFEVNPTIFNCKFTNNIKSLYIQNSQIVLKDNEFSSNFFGLDIYDSKVTVINNSFSDNFEISIFAKNSNIVFDNTITQNSRKSTFTLSKSLS